MIWIFLIISLFSSVLTAPTAKTQLYDILTADSRVEKLINHRFVKPECKQSNDFSKSLCFALYDVGISIATKNLDYNRVNASFDKGNFCDSLSKVVPDTPSNNDSSNAFNGKAKWFKDILREEDLCGQRCIYSDPETYDDLVRPVCRFLFNQYTFLANQSNIPSSSVAQKVGEISRES